MNTFSFRCPHCGIEMEAQEEWRGLESSCPGCGKTIKIPGGDSIKQEITPEKAKDNQHLVFARLAMQTLAYDEAQKEFNCVLGYEPTNIEALFGNKHTLSGAPVHPVPSTIQIPCVRL